LVGGLVFLFFGSGEEQPWSDQKENGSEKNQNDSKLSMSS
jgi:hypothetical protein